jgi:hypothetical protein
MENVHEINEFWAICGTDFKGRALWYVVDYDGANIFEYKVEDAWRFQTAKECQDNLGAAGDCLSYYNSHASPKAVKVRLEIKAEFLETSS